LECPQVSADLVPVFGVLTVIGVAVAAAFLRSMSASSTADHVGLRIDVDVPGVAGGR